MFYTVIENQANNGFALLYYHYTDLNQALAKYYTVLAAAAVSQIEYHSAHIIRSDGVMIEGRVFDRREQEEPAEE